MRDTRALLLHSKKWTKSRLQTPEKCVCSGFFAAKPQKNQNKKGFGAAPQWEISVSFMRMGDTK
jgi:hypothetical protein